jgi:hypothetical protein
MRWLLWRQQRLVLSVIGVLDVALTAWAWHQSRDYARAVRLRCPGFGSNSTFHSTSALCQSLVPSTTSVVGRFSSISLAAFALCVLAGVILAVTLIVTEFDRSTIRISWSQTQTRGQWLLWEWFGGAISVAILATPLSLVLGYWPATTHIDNVGLTGSGGMPIVYGLLAFSVTGLVGVVIRRNGWTIAVSLALVLGVYFGIGSVEKRYLDRPTVTYSLSQSTRFEPPTFALWINAGAAPYKPGVIPNEASVRATNYDLLSCSGAGKAISSTCWKKYNTAEFWVFVPPTELPTLIEEVITMLGGLLLIAGLTSVLVIRRMSV